MHCSGQAAHPRRALREALDRVDLFFAHGPAAREEILAAGLPPERMRAGTSSIADTDAPPLRGLPSPRIVFAGRLHPDKGPDLLLEALARMAEPAPAFLLGAGVMEPELRRRATRLGIEQRVHFEGWRDAPASWIAGASVCVVPSRFDAWSQTAALAIAWMCRWWVPRWRACRACSGRGAACWWRQRTPPRSPTRSTAY